MNTSRINKMMHKKEKGQIIVLLAIMFLGLIAVVGLAIDMGYLYVSYARLRKAVDAAALGATSQFREGYTSDMIRQSAQQFLDLNEVTADPANIHIDTCDSTQDPNPLYPDGLTKYPPTVAHPEGGDWRDDGTGVCTNPKRKLVRVTVTEDVPLFFLSVVGIHSVPIRVYSISEAASVDLIMVIDTSESMTSSLSGDNRDPKTCNEGTDTALKVAYGINGYCQPFNAIKVAALAFLDRLYQGYDRVGIVTFDQWPTMVQPLTDNFTLVRDMLRGPEHGSGAGIKVFEGFPGGCEMVGAGYNSDTTPDFPIDVGAPCRLKNPDGSYWGLDCPMTWGGGTDLSHCTTTNIGGGLRMAGNALGGAYPTGFSAIVREEALWVVLLLTDGITNAGYTAETTPQAICPADTWTNAIPCQDTDTRPTLTDTFNARHADTDITHYDADDFARDMVDFVTDPVDGQGAMLFSIGLDNGHAVTYLGADVAGNPPGETLLKYAADRGGGVYYYAPTADQLTAIFLDIANKIATRLSR